MLAAEQLKDMHGREKDLVDYGQLINRKAVSWLNKPVSHMYEYATLTHYHSYKD